MDAKIKLQIVKSVTALICVGCLCVSAVSASGKIADSIKAGAQGGGDTAQAEFYDDNTDADVVADDGAAPVDEAVTDAAGETPVADDAGTVADTDTGADTENTTSAAAGNSKKAATTAAAVKNGAPQTKAEIVEYCNKALNNAKESKAGYTKTYVRKCEGDLPSIVTNLIKQNKTSTMAKGGDNKDDFPAGGYTWSSKLRESDVTSATCKQNGQYYEITLKLGKEVNPGKGEASSYGRVMTVITPEDAKAMLSAIKTVTLSYHDGYVYAKIDSKTGKLVKAEFSASADLSADISVLGNVTADNVISTETFTNFVW